MAKKQHDEEELIEAHDSLDEAIEAAVAEDAAQADDQITTLTNELKRAQADFVNYKRRADAEKGELLDFAKTRVVRDFLSVRDTLDQERAHRPTGIDEKWAASIDSIGAQFDSVLKSLGVEKFVSLGHVFDPHLHNAVTMQEGDGAHEVVVSELQPGYKLGSTVLRHAMVVVGHADNPITVIESEQEEDDVQPDAGNEV